MRRCAIALGVAAILVAAGSAELGAETITWKGASGRDWLTAANWDLDRAPVGGDHVVITNAGTAPILTNATPALASLTISNKTLLFTNWVTALNATTVTMQAGAVFTLSGSFATNEMSNRVSIACTDFTMEPGSLIDADAHGYSEWNGPGTVAGSGDYYWPGGSYGGKGGRGWYAQTWGRFPYGSASAPILPGSGGGSYNDATRRAAAGKGGGAVRIAATGEVAIRGTISARGGTAVNDLSAGGSGGAVYITCATFGGGTSGLVRVDGGNVTALGYSGGGGGGRIAVNYTSLGAESAVRFSAAPATNGWFYGSPDHRRIDRPLPGTLWLPDAQLLSETLDGSRFAGAVNLVSLTNWAPSSLTVSNCEVYFGEPGSVLTVAGDVRVDAGGTLGIGMFVEGSNCELRCGGDLVLTNGGALYVYAGQTGAVADAYGAFVGVTNAMVVGAGSWVYPVAHWTNGGAPLFSVGSLLVEPNGGFNARASGYRAAWGPGSKGPSGTQAPGASHGGRGGFNPGDGHVAMAVGTYGSVSNPVVPGSGGGGHNIHYWKSGHGGGVIRLQIAGAATIRGTVAADGAKATDVYNGGGAGGSVWLACDTFGGTTQGLISAAGGDSHTTVTCGGGGGGRIALAYQALDGAPAVRFSTRRPSLEWANDGSDDRYPMRARWGTLWLPDTRLLSASLTDRQFDEVSLFGPSSWAVGSLTVSNCAVSFAENQFALTVTNDLLVETNAILGLGNWSGGTNYALRCGGSALLTNGGALYLFSGVTNWASTNYGLLFAVTNELVLGPGSWIYPHAHETDGGAAVIRAADVRIAAGAGVNASSKGFGAQKGPGAGSTVGTYTGGGGHGGRGGTGSDPMTGGVPYDSVDEPLLPGSGGGGHAAHYLSGPFGGGAVRIAATGTVTLDGTLAANGGTSFNRYCGAAAGGGVYLTCQMLEGATGVIRADGGNPTLATQSGPGGGGRIALDYQVLDSPHSLRITASPGTIGWAYADRANRWRHMPQMGSVSLPDTGLLASSMDGSGLDDAFVYFTRTGAWEVAALTVTACTVSIAEERFSLVVSNDLTIGAGGEFGIGDGVASTGAVLACGGSLLLTNGGALAVYAGPTNGATNAYGALVAVTGSFVVAAGSWVYPESHPDTGGAPLLRVGSLAVESGGGFSANGMGFAPRRGPGKGADGSYPGGAGHGGRGGDGSGGVGGLPYGVTNGPVTPGSGGGSYPGVDRYGKNGHGGGTIRIESSGAVALDGTLRAAGGSGIFDNYGSGAAGGAIYVACGAFSGGTSAVLEVSGGSSYNSNALAGAGGGGRIAVWQGVPQATREQALRGETVPNLVESTLFPNYTGAIAFTNGAGRATNPAQPGSRVFLRLTAGAAYFLQVSGKPNDTYGSPQPLGYGTHLDIPVGTMITNSVASPADEAAGTRHACLGWRLEDDLGALIASESSTQAVFEVTTNLFLIWSWTNEHLLTVSSATPTSGAVNAEAVNGWYTNGLVVSGIEASASNGFAFSAWTGDVPPVNALDNPLALTMTQPRTVQATFIAAVSEVKTWSGYGFWTNGANWTPAGAPTPLDQAVIGSGTCLIDRATYAASLAVSNGAFLMCTNWSARLYVAGDVTVQSNGTITLPAAFTEAQMSNRIDVACSNLTVALSGRLEADGKGYYPWNGPGKGTNSTYGTGAGHGGKGGRGYPDSLLPVGMPYGSVSAPTEPGSGGGSNPGLTWQPRAGSGGGAIRLEVSGTLTVDGTISANGASADPTAAHSAGGAGGSVFITCGVLTGSTNGLVSVRGGSGGATDMSGGGGGGRIAVDYAGLGAERGIRFCASPAARDYATVDMTNRWMQAARMGTLWLPDAALLEAPMTDWRFRDVSLVIPGLDAWTVDSLTISRGSFAFAESGFSLVVSNDLVVDEGGMLTLGAYGERGSNYALRAGGNLILTNGGALAIWSGETNAVLTNGGFLVSVTNTLATGAGSWLLLRGNPTNGGSPRIEAGTLAVGAGGGIDANGGGFGWARGPGLGLAGTYGGAGGYGGRGGAGADPSAGGAPYGAPDELPQPGSGGAGNSGHLFATGCGGGLVRVLIAGAATVDGTIAADGSDGLDQYGSAGSGGGILLRCQTFGGAASGLISARGGDRFSAPGGGGGGGRIVVDYSALTPAHAVRFAAAGGASWAADDYDRRWWHRTQDGTLWLPDAGCLTNVIAAGAFDGVRLYLPAAFEWAVPSLTVQGSTVTFAGSGSRVAVAGDVLVDGGRLGIGDDLRGTGYVFACGGRLVLTNGGVLYAHAGMTNGPAPGYGTLVQVDQDATVSDGCWVWPVAHETNGGSVLVRIGGDLTVGTNAGFTASSRGYISRYGPGRGSLAGNTGSSGAGYGGRGGDANGGAVGGQPYGSTNAPSEPGSGGGGYNGLDWFLRGGCGGGAVRLEVGGTLTLWGTLAADGGPAYYSQHSAGGSGGAVYLSCGGLVPKAGSLITARGGDAYLRDSDLAGGGGGGRIALWLGVHSSDRTRILAGLAPERTIVTNEASAYPDLTVSVTNGTGYVTASMALPGTLRLLAGLPPPGSVFMLR